MLTAMFAVVRDLFVLFAALFWMAGVAHAAADTPRRFANPAARAFWVGVAGFVPVLGLGLYLIVRPAETRLVGAENDGRKATAAKSAEGQELSGAVAAVPLEATV
jgi:hypothetical protein